MKRIITLLKPMARGIIKSFPLGNAIIEGVKSGKAQVNGKPAPHNWVSILMQFICIGAIIYAFITHAISLDTLLKYLGF